MVTVNPFGAEVYRDGEVPRTFTARAIEVISGGDLVTGSFANIGSSVNQLSDGTIQVSRVAAPDSVNGIAINTVGSNGLVSVARRGDYIMRAGGAVSGGMAVVALGADSVMNVGAGITGSIVSIGRSFNTAGSEQFCLVSLNL